MGKQRLVVIGNGMAGARAVEEILGRGGAELFDITMFGDEPYGNYNRILLSNVLNGSQEPDEIFLNPLGWYEENGDPAARRASRRSRSTGRPRKVRSDQGRDRVLRQAAHRHRQPCLHPAHRRHDDRERRAAARLFAFRTLDDMHGIMQASRAGDEGGGDRRRPPGPRGGARAAEFGCEVHVIHLGRASHGAAARRARPARILKTTMEGMGVKVHLEKATTAVPGRGAGHRPRLQGRHDAGLRHGRGLRRHPAERGDRPALPASRSSAASSSTTRCARSTIPTSMSWASARSIAAGSTGSWRRCGSRRRCWPTTSPETNRDAAYHGSKLATKLKVMGVEWPRWASPSRR